MTSIPCRVTLNSRRYQILADGTVYAVRPVDVEYSTPNEPCDNTLASAVRKEASRQRRNRRTREIHDAYRSLGLVKTPYGWE